MIEGDAQVDAQDGWVRVAQAVVREVEDLACVGEAGVAVQVVLADAHGGAEEGGEAVFEGHLRHHFCDDGAGAGAGGAEAFDELKPIVRVRDDAVAGDVAPVGCDGVGFLDCEEGDEEDGEGVVAGSGEETFGLGYDGELRGGDFLDSLCVDLASSSRLGRLGTF